MNSRTSPDTDPNAGSPAPPAVLRFGAAAVLLQCAVLFGYAVFLIASNLRGAADGSVASQSRAAHYVGVGTAVFIIIVFGFVAYSAMRLLRGRSTGSGAIVLIEAILIGVAFYMFSGGAWALGTATLLSAALALVGVFHPASWEYLRAIYARQSAAR